MNNNEYNNLRIITGADDLPEGAKYYSCEHFDSRAVHQSWNILYDAAFRVLDTVRVKYFSAFDGLDRIARADDHDPVLLAYLRTPLNSGYVLVEQDGDTLPLLEAAARNVSR